MLFHVILRAFRRHGIIFIAAICLIYSLHSIIQRPRKREFEHLIVESKPTTNRVVNHANSSKKINDEYAFPEHDIDDDIYIRLRDDKTEAFPASNKFPLQLKKLEKFHGVIVEKHSLDYYVGVEYPLFVDKHDPNGLGEMGVPVPYSHKGFSEEQEKERRTLMEKNSFNEYLSQRISVRRKLGDCSSEECKRRRADYPKKLPPVDVIIVFFNEAWSTLLRTVHSVLLRTPEHLLGEIILVDDNSTAEYIKSPLEKYFSQEPKVKIVRAQVRSGLIKARLLGYYASTSPILVFLDAHCECFPGWLEPLLAPIKSNFKAVTFPNIERINPGRFNVGCINDMVWYGVFKLATLVFDWAYLSGEEIKKRKKDPRLYADNIRSPTMPGGLFAISRKFFEMVGTYDPGLEHWGAENMELSFKTWMCHGDLVTVPCSHVGHIYRSKNPIKSYVNIGNRNSVRVAEVWMDDYKNYYYLHSNFQMAEPGDLRERKAIRKRLKCHDFAWYHHNIYPNMTNEIPLHSGEIRLHGTSLCVDSMGGRAAGHLWVELYSCHGQGGSQYWNLNTKNQIHTSGSSQNLCGIGSGALVTKHCVSGKVQWKYRVEDSSLYHIPFQKCLTGNSTSRVVSLDDCDSRTSQKWDFKSRGAGSNIHFPV